MGIMLPKYYLIEKALFTQKSNRNNRTQNLLPNCLYQILQSEHVSIKLMSVMMFSFQSMDILLIASFLLELSLLSFVVKQHKQHEQALTQTMILM